MLIEASHDLYMVNGELKRHAKLEFDFETSVAYEVLRIMDGRPLFLSEHMKRMKNSILAISGESESAFVDRSIEKIEDGIRTFISECGLLNHNVKILAGNFDISGSRMDIIIHANPTFYPPAKFYEEGADTAVVHEERNNPNVKAINADLNEKIRILKHETGIYEALLCDHNGMITEGSKSNVFFVKGNTVLTPRVDLVLPGITRQMVLLAAQNAGIEAREHDIEEAALSGYDAAFLTGTSLHILPIRNIGDIHLNSSKNDVVIRLQEAFRDIVERGC